MSNDIRRARPPVSYQQRIRLLGADSQPLLVDTTLPYLRLGSDGQALYDGQDSRIDGRGVLPGVRPVPVGSEGLPQLEGDGAIESATPPSEAWSSGPSWSASGLSREDASVGGAFTTWDRPPLMAGSIEPPVVTDPGLADGERSEVTVVVQTRSPWKALAARFERLPAWSFAVLAVLAIVAFGIMYAAINAVPPGSEASRQAEAAAPDRSSAARTNAVGALQPLVVPSAGWPGTAGEGATTSASAATPAPAPTPAPEPTPAPGPAAAPAPLAAHARLAGPFASGVPHPRGRTHPALIGLRGSASPDAAAGNDMRGVNVAVESSSLYLEVTLPRPASDRKFGVQVTPSWPTTLAVAGKSTTGFTVSFGTPAPAHAHLDWLLVR